MIRLKEGVRLCSADFAAPSPIWGVVLPIIDSVFGKYGSDTVITSAFDGKHKNGSFHYVGRALDFRIWHVDAASHADLVVSLKDALGPGFDVILEKDHIHIEFDSKG